MTDIQTFLQHSSEIQALQQELTQALEGKQGEEAARAICEVASNYNFTLDIKEITVLLHALAEKYDQNSELSESELEGVSGGVLLGRTINPNLLKKWKI